MKMVIDAPHCEPGESRCRHEMLAFGRKITCSWCKGIADVSISESAQLIDDERRALRWAAAEQRGECAACAAVIEKREPIAYSPEHQALIGRCCGET